MTALLHKHVIITGPAVVLDEAGRKVRNRVIQPCGCRTEDIWTVASIAGASHEGWNRVSSACETHAAAVAVMMLQFSEGKNGTLALPPQQRKFLDSAPAILAAAEALDAELLALTGNKPFGIAEQLGAAFDIAGALPQAPVAAQLESKGK